MSEEKEIFKNVKIKEDSYLILKLHCKDNGLKIYSYLSKLINKELKNDGKN